MSEVILLSTAFQRVCCAAIATVSRIEEESPETTGVLYKGIDRTKDTGDGVITVYVTILINFPVCPSNA